MALVPHKITALAESDAQGTSGKNIVENAIVSLYDASGAAVTLFDNEAGSNGSTVKQTDATGQVVVYVTPGEYDEEVNGSVKRRVLIGNKELTTAQLIDSVRGSQVGDVITTTGFSVEGDGGAGQWKKTGATGVTSQNPAQRGEASLTDANGDVWELLPLYGFSTQTYQLESLGLVADGVTDDTLVIQAALNSGSAIAKSASCKVTAAINASLDDSGLFGVTLLADAASFNRTDGDYNNTNGTIILATGNNWQMSDCKITMDGALSAENTTCAMVLRGNKFDVQHCEFYNFAKTKVVRIETGKRGSKFNWNHIHDCLLSSATNGQLTALDIDDNRDVTGDPTRGIEVAHNHIENMLASAAFEASFFYQTDGINISFAETTENSIHHNKIVAVGEGIDCFGKFNDIHDNTISDSQVSGVKLINGASYNSVHHNIIVNPRTYGVTVAGSSLAGRDVVANNIYGNIVSGVNPNNDSAITSFAFGCEGVDVSKPKENVFRGNTAIDCANASRIIFSETTDNSNIIELTKTSGTLPATIVTNDSGGIVTFADKAQVIAYPSAQAIGAGGATLDLANVTKDSQSELSGGTYTASVPRVVDVSANVRTGAATSGKFWTMEVLLNGSRVAINQRGVANSGDNFFDISVTGLMLVEGDTLSVYVNNDEAAPRAITSDSQYSVRITER